MDAEGDLAVPTLERPRVVRAGWPKGHVHVYLWRDWLRSHFILRVHLNLNPHTTVYCILFNTQSSYTVSYFRMTAEHIKQMKAKQKLFFFFARVGGHERRVFSPFSSLHQSLLPFHSHSSLSLSLTTAPPPSTQAIYPSGDTAPTLTLLK